MTPTVSHKKKRSFPASWLEKGWPGLVGVELDGRQVRAAYRPAGSARYRLVVSEQGRALEELVRTNGLSGKPAAALLEGSEVTVRRMTLPALRRADLFPALTLECRKHASIPIEDAEIRYEVLGRSSQGGFELLVAIAPRRMVEERRRALERSGLRPVALTIRPAALRALLETGSAGRHPGPPRDERPVAALDMGWDESHITVLRGEEIRFTRETGIGISSFIAALRAVVVPGSALVCLGPGEAEEIIRRRGIPGGDEQDPFAEGIPASAVAVMLRPILERLVRELWNSLDYVHEQYQGEAVGRVLVLNEAVRIPHLAEHLAGILKIPVEPADFSIETAGTEPSRPEGATALGLALLGRGSINFFEPPGAGAVYRLAEALPQRVAIAAAAVLLLSVSLPAELSVVRQRREVAALDAKVRELAPLRERIGAYRALRGEEERSRALLGRLAQGMPLWSEVLRDLTHRVGPDARLTSLELLEPEDVETAAPAGDVAPVSVTAGSLRIRITGLVRREGLRSERPLGELMETIERSPHVQAVRLIQCQAVDPATSRFVLTAELNGSGVTP